MVLKLDAPSMHHNSTIVFASSRRSEYYIFQRCKVNYVIWPNFGLKSRSRNDLNISCCGACDAPGQNELISACLYLYSIKIYRRKTYIYIVSCDIITVLSFIKGHHGWPFSGSLMQCCTRFINNSLIRHDSEVFEPIRCVLVAVDISVIEL